MLMMAVRGMRKDSPVQQSSFGDPYDLCVSFFLFSILFLFSFHFCFIVDLMGSTDRVAGSQDIAAHRNHIFDNIGLVYV